MPALAALLAAAVLAVRLPHSPARVAPALTPPVPRAGWVGACRLGLAGGALAASVLLAGPQHASAVASSCSDESNPSFTVRHCRNVGMDAEGRLPRCPANSNCVSTSSVASPEHFLPPWSALSAGSSADALSERDVRVAWNALNDAVSSTPGLAVLERDDVVLYLRAEGASSVPPTSLDDIELVLRRDGTVTFHSESRDTVFMYPLQRPVGDNNRHQKRLEELRLRLGWDDLSERMGYDLSAQGGEPGRGSGGFTLGRFVPLM
jgi:uncharacterized protein (DUF1499 family)